MATIIITGKTCRNVPKVKKMLEDFLCGKITFNRFIDFIEENDLEIKTSFISDDEERSVDKIEELKLDGFENIEDDITLDEERAVQLYRDLCKICKEYHKRSFGDKDSVFKIDTFTPEKIIRFIGTLHLPVKRLEHALNESKGIYYKNRIYRNFEDFEKCMKEAYGVDDVWEADLDKCPEWFKDIRDSLYSREHPEEDENEYIELESDEWEEFQKWRKERNKENPAEYANKLFREIMKLKQNLSLSEVVGINNLAMTKNIEGLEECAECLKKSKNASLINIILKYSSRATTKEDKDKETTSKKTKSSKEKDSVNHSEIEARKLFNKIIDDFNPVFTGNALQYFENNFSAHKPDFIDRLQILYDGVKKYKGRCGVDVDSHGTITYNPIIISVINETASKATPKKSKATTTKTKATTEKTKTRSTTSKKSKDEHRFTPGRPASETE